MTLINTYRNPARLFIAGGGEILSREGTTQGDPLAMPFYAVFTSLLITILRQKFDCIKQVWLADHASAAGNLDHLYVFFNCLQEEGKRFGYLVNAKKSWLILKSSNNLSRAQSIFKDSKIQITTEGQGHLGAALGSESFRESYINDKVIEWIKEQENLTLIAKSQPQAAYSAYVNEYKHKFTYFICTIPGIARLLQPIEDLITSKLLPTIFGSDISELDRSILSLPTRFGGLGIPDIVEEANFEYNTSKILSAPLAALIVTQTQHKLPDDQVLNDARKNVNTQRETRIGDQASTVDQNLDQEKLRTISQIRNKGTSNWLNVLPLEDEGYVLNKQEFRDALALRYNRSISGLPSTCPCSLLFNTVHALDCKKGGFEHSRHDEIRDLEAALLSQVCKDVATEPALQPVTGENFALRSANIEDNARLDVKASGFFRSGQCAFFDIRVAHVNASSYGDLSTEQILDRAEKEKKRAYNSRVMEVEHGTFTPLVFGTNGAMGEECAKFHKLLAAKLAQKNRKRYSTVMQWLRTRLSFSILRSALLCLRGTRVPFYRPVGIDTDFIKFFFQI